MFPERIKRVEELVARELAQILDREIKDPRIGMVTVTRAKVSKDLRIADVWVSRHDDDPKADRECLEGLAKANGYIRRLLGERVELRFLPELKFHVDHGLREAFKIESILQEIHKNDPPPSQPANE